MEILFYDVNYMSENPVKTQIEAREFMKREGFAVFPYFKVCEDFDEVKSAIDEIEIERKNIDYLTDGAVVKANDENVRAAMGYTDKFPRWAIAYKFEAEEAESVVENVVWQVGRTGKLTPLAEISPVELAGATVRRATLNNYGDLQKKDVKINSRVLVRRSNEVIPEILGAVSHTEGSVPVEKPARCPYCGSEVKEVGANLFCSNRHCPPRIVQKLTHFCSKNAMDVEGMSEATLTLLMEKRGVKTFSDLYALDRESFAGMEGFRDRKADNLLNAIQKSKRIPLDRFLYALGITGVGRVAARDLAAFGSVEKISNLTEEELIGVEDVGEITARGIADFFRDEENQAEIARLFEAGVTPYTEERKREGVFAGETVVLTGTLSAMGRSEAQKIIEAEGGVAASSVSGKTTLVVAGESAGSKLDKAKKLGVKIIGEEEFLKLLANIGK